MSSGVEIYQCNDTLHRVETRPLSDVLRAAFQPLFERDLSRARFSLYLHAVPEYHRPPGRPRVDNLLPTYGYATVVMAEDGLVTYRHPHPVRELIAVPLQRELGAAHPEDTVWGYRIVGPGIPRTMSRLTPEVESAVAVAPYRSGEGPGFKIRRVPDPDPPLRRLADFGVDAGNDGEAENGDFVKVLVHEPVARDLEVGRAFSEEVEEGGFLVGRVFREAARDGTFLVEVNGALAAQHTGASLLHFTFTGDSFLEIKRRLRRRQGDQLLGWYHTHLFPASEEMGLSTIDLELHFTTFKKPWQLAGLVNFERDGGRRLRFYVRRDDAMVLCPQWVVAGGGA